MCTLTGYSYIFKMISIITLLNTSILSPVFVFVFVLVRTFIYSLSDSQVNNTMLLTTITMLYIRAPEFIHLTT